MLYNNLKIKYYMLVYRIMLKDYNVMYVLCEFVFYIICIFMYIVNKIFILYGILFICLIFMMYIVYNFKKVLKKKLSFFLFKFF